MAWSSKSYTTTVITVYLNTRLHLYSSMMWHFLGHFQGSQYDVSGRAGAAHLAYSRHACNTLAYKKHLEVRNPRVYTYICIYILCINNSIEQTYTLKNRLSACYTLASFPGLSRKAWWLLHAHAQNILICKIRCILPINDVIEYWLLCLANFINILARQLQAMPW